MTTKVHAEAGFTLVELLIAMTLMAIGIAAIVAGFSSGVFAIGRASQASTGAAIADQQMETYRQEPYSAIIVNMATCASPAPAAVPQTGSDGRTYLVTTAICATTPSTSGGTSGEQVKQVTITVVDKVTNKTLVTESSTFDSLTG